MTKLKRVRSGFDNFSKGIFFKALGVKKNVIRNSVSI